MSSLVLVERQNLLFKTGEFVPFCLDGEPDRISVQWIDDKTLAVQCRGCEELYGYGEPNWGSLQFRHSRLP
jgi:hypothetical protein